MNKKIKASRITYRQGRKNLKRQRKEFIDLFKKDILKIYKDKTPDNLNNLLTKFRTLPIDQQNRLLESVLKFDSGANPKYTILDGIKQMIFHPIKRNKTIDYIITGQGEPKLFSSHRINPYNGLFGNDYKALGKVSEPIENGFIDAMIYDKEINTNIGKASDPLDFGIEHDYIKQNYPSKKVQYITTEPKILENQENIKPTIYYGAKGSFKTKMPGITINNQGIILEEGVRNDSTFVRGLDVYDFKAKDYVKKWLDDDVRFLPTIQHIDNVTTPVVVKTPWVYKDNIHDIIGNHSGFDFLNFDFNTIDSNKSIYKQSDGSSIHFKMGGKQKQNKLQVKNGVAQPLGKGYYLMNGPSHEQGGIDIGKNLEVEGGEVVKINPKSIKVVTAQKIMGGKSPAELVVDASSTGEQEKVFNKVFNYQEEFKDRHKLNDDGTKKAKFGILKKFKNWLFNVPSGFERVKENDSPTKEASEFIENDIAKRQESFYKIAKEKGHDSEPYFIPYLDDKEIIINGAGRASSNMLDSLAVNSKKAKVPFVDALGLAVEETKMGATPNISTNAWIDSFIKTNDRKPTSEEIKAKERELLNTSFARNFEGIHPQFLINDHEWFKRGWEDSNKYKNILKDIKSPLQHGLTLYKLGLYNTGDKYHKTKVQFAGNKAIKSKDVQNWLKTSEYAKQIEKYKLGGDMKIKKKADLGIYDTLNKYGQSFLYPSIEPAVVSANTKSSKSTKSNKSVGEQMSSYAKHFMYNSNEHQQKKESEKKSTKSNNKETTNTTNSNSNINTIPQQQVDYRFLFQGPQRPNVPFPYRLEEDVDVPQQTIEVVPFVPQNKVTVSEPVVKKVPTQKRTDVNSKSTQANAPVVEMKEKVVETSSTLKAEKSKSGGLNLDFLNEITNPNGSTTNLRTGQTYFKDWNKVRRTPYSSLNLKTGEIEYAGFINPYGSKLQSAVYNAGPEEREKRAAKERLLNTGDWINIGANAAGAITNLLTGLLTPNIKYARLSDPIPVTAPKINSNVNTTAEEDAVDDAYYDELKAIDENTADSKVALNRKRKAAFKRAANKVKIRAAAENMRRDLINEGSKLHGEYAKYNASRADQVRAYNAQAAAAEFNANRTKIGDAITGFVSDLGAGASTITNAIEKRESDRINTVLSYMGNPEVNPENFEKGFDKIYERLYGRKPSKYISKKYNKV